MSRKTKRPIDSRVTPYFTHGNMAGAGGATAGYYAGVDEVPSAGAYSVETDEELLDGISFPAYRRISTLIRMPKEPSNPAFTRALTIDPALSD